MRITYMKENTKDDTNVNIKDVIDHKRVLKTVKPSCLDKFKSFLKNISKKK